MGKKILYTIVLSASLLFLSCFQKAHGSHVMGSEIDWKCVGQDSFEVTLTVYRDCKGAELQKPSLNYTCAPSSIEELDYDSEDITPTCDEQPCTQCDGSCPSLDYGFERHYVTWLVDFSETNCSEVTFSYRNCCRNGDITTGPANDWYYVDAWMDMDKAPCNNSPQFEADTLTPIYCKGQEVYFSQGISSNDKDSTGNILDSTTFEWAKPLQDAGQEVNWNSNFDHLNPVSWKGKNRGLRDMQMPFGLHLNPSTGDLQFTPTKAGEQTVMAFKVTEYRDGEKVAYTRRDIQVVVENCPDNKAPRLSGYNCNDDYYKEVCEGESVSFNFCGTDPDNPSKDDTVFLNFRRQNLPSGATWTDNNGEVREPTGTLSWTPQKGDASDKPYSFSIVASDDHCPINARASITYRIKVNPQPEANYSTKYQECGRYKFNAQATRGEAVSFQWTGAGGLFSNLKSFTHQYPGPGEYPYTLQLSANGCDNEYEDTIKLDQFLNVDIGNDTTICYGGSVELGGTAKDSKGPVTYTWHDSVTGQKNRTFNNIKEDTVLYLTVEDTVCNFTDTVHVNIRGLPEVDLGTDRRICADDTLRIEPLVRGDTSSSVSPPWLYLSNGNLAPLYDWRMEGSGSTLSDTSFYNFTDSGTYVLEVSDTFECSNTDTIQIYTNPALEAEAFPKQICRGESSDLKATVTGGDDAEYIWVNLSNGDTLTGKEVTVNPLQTTDYRLFVEERKGGVFCQDSTELTLTVNRLPTVLIRNLPGQCSNADTLGLNRFGIPQPDPADPVEESQWRIHTNKEALDGSVLDPQKLAPGSYDLTYSYTDSNGCIDSSTGSIDIHPLPNLNVGKDTVICEHRGAYEISPNRANPSAYWEGEGTAALSRTSQSTWEFEPTHEDVSTGEAYELIYYFTENSSNRCSNTDTINIRIQRSPDINVTDAQLCLGDDEIELTKDPVNGTWFGDHIEGDQTFVNPGNSGDYEVYFTAETNIYRTCADTQSVNVTVHALPEVEANTLSGERIFCSRTEEVVLDGNPPDGTPEAGGSTGVGSWQGKAVSRDGDQFYFDPSIAGPSEGDGYELTYTFNDTTTGCSNTATLNAEVDPQPIARIRDQSSLYCIGRPYQVEATYSNVDRIEWRTNASDPERGFNNSRMNDGVATVNYRPNETQRENSAFEIYLEGYGSDVCEPVRDTLEVNISAQPSADFTAVQEGCSPFTTEFRNESTIDESNGSTIARYQWRFGNGNTSVKENPEHTYKQHGEYNVTLFAVSDGGCVDTMKKYNYIHVYPKPEARFTADPTFTIISTSLIDFNNQTRYAEESARFQWNFGDYTIPDGGTSTERDPSHQYTDTGQYTVSLNVENGYGCRDTLVRENYVTIEPAVVHFAPNAFTPNNDGDNDIYRVEASNFTDFQINIYNRWGEELYSSRNYENHGWDGTYKGAEVPVGTYMYLVKLQGMDGEEYSFSGTINLIR